MTHPGTPSTNTPDRIEKQILLKAPLARVWKALTDHREFGAWFLVDLEGPFAIGLHTRGRIRYPGFEHLVMDMLVERIEPMTCFSYRWHPGAIDAGVDYTQEPRTLVEFILKEVPEGTLLTVIESGFAALPPGRRETAFRLNDGGWTQQVLNIETYVTANP